MPQMAPIWWSTMFMVFILSLMMTIVIMYFHNTYKLNTTTYTVLSKKNNLHWKW